MSKHESATASRSAIISLQTRERGRRCPLMSQSATQTSRSRRAEEAAWHLHQLSPQRQPGCRGAHLRPPRLRVRQGARVQGCGFDSAGTGFSRASERHSRWLRGGAGHHRSEVDWTSATRRGRSVWKIPTTSCASSWRPRWRAVSRWCRCWSGMRRCLVLPICPQHSLHWLFGNPLKFGPIRTFTMTPRDLCRHCALILDPNAPQIEPLSARPKRSVGAWLAWTLASVATVAAAALAMPALKHLREKPPLETRTEIHVAPQSGVSGTMALSPDGRQIVFADNSAGVPRLWLRRLVGDHSASHCPAPRVRASPFWSPDSRSIGFFANSSLKRIDLGSGTATDACACIPLRPGWQLECTRRHPVFAGTSQAHRPHCRDRWRAAGSRRESKRMPSPRSARCSCPTVVALCTCWLEAKLKVRIWGRWTVPPPFDCLPPSAASPTFPPAGCLTGKIRVLLVAQRLDADKAVLVGEPVTLAEGVLVRYPLSATGLVAYWNGTSREASGSCSGEVGPVASWVPLESRTILTMSPRVSPDGRRVAVTRGESGKQDLWLLEGERASRVTFDGAGNSIPGLVTRREADCI